MLYQVNTLHHGVWSTRQYTDRKQAVLVAEETMLNVYKVQPDAVIVIDMYGTVVARYGRLNMPQGV